MTSNGPPGPVRALATCLLLAAMAVFCLGEVLLVRTYRTVDGYPGLSVADLQIAFSEDSRSLFEARIRTDMRSHLDDAEYATLLGWIRSGAGEKEYTDGIANLLDKRCTGCHKADGEAAFRELDTYARVQAALAEPPSPPFRFMLTTTKIHLIGIGLLIAIPVLAAQRSALAARVGSWPVWAAYAGLALDFGAWWAMRIHPGFAVVRMVGHAMLLVSFATLCAIALRATWGERP